MCTGSLALVCCNKAVFRFQHHHSIEIRRWPRLRRHACRSRKYKTGRARHVSSNTTPLADERKHQHHLLTLALDPTREASPVAFNCPICLRRWVRASVPFAAQTPRSISSHTGSTPCVARAATVLGWIESRSRVSRPNPSLDPGARSQVSAPRVPP